VNCQQVEFGEIAEKYVLGRLNEPERIAFEEHYFLCPKCLEELRIWQAVQQTTVPVAVRRTATRLYVWAAAAAAVAAILFFGLTGATRVWRRSEAPAPVAGAGSNGAKDRLQLLARVEAPPYKPPVLRGAADDAERQYRAAMLNYARGDYGGAADGLKAALASDPEAAGPRFYLGVCDLLLGRVDDAVTELRRADSVGKTLYQEEARFFLAKALIARRDVAAASQTLEAIVPLAGDRQADARNLLEQLRNLPK
jgi:tetratricopeptide (TPR) repeat protein